jgi:hypothetical protein
VTITKVKANQYVLSDRGTWLPGVYASRDAALLAARLDVSALAALWAGHLERHGSKAVLREADLLG